MPIFWEEITDESEKSRCLKSKWTNSKKTKKKKTIRFNVTDEVHFIYEFHSRCKRITYSSNNDLRIMATIETSQ